MNDMTRQQLDAYLDGAMNVADRQRFERQIQHDPELQRAVDDQRRIDHTLKRLFPVQATGGAAAALARIGITQERHQPNQPLRLDPRPKQDSPSAWRRWAAVAAVFTICTYALWANRSYYFPQPTHRIAGQSRSLELFYRAKVDSGYKPEISLASNTELATLVRDRFGESLSMSTLPASYSLRGADSCDMLSKKTLALLMSVEGREVIVLIDKATTGAHAPLSATCHLHSFETQVGALKLVEVTPWPDSRVLALFKGAVPNR
jgi:hypothetical protein